MDNNLVNSTLNLINKTEKLLNQDEVYLLELENKETLVKGKKLEFQQLEKDNILLEKGLTAFNQFTVELTQGAVEHLTKLINQGLDEVFNNEEVKYSIRIELISRKNNNQANFILIKQTDTSVLETKLSDNGFGIQSFVGLILRFYFILQNNLPRVLFIDEGLTAISVNHLPKVKLFLDQLCKKFNFAILLIAHDSDLFKLGDYFYTVTPEGTLEEGVFNE